MNRRGQRPRACGSNVKIFSEDGRIPRKCDQKSTSIPKFLCCAAPHTFDNSRENVRRLRHFCNLVLKKHSLTKFLNNGTSSGKSSQFLNIKVLASEQSPRKWTKFYTCSYPICRRTLHANGPSDKTSKKRCPMSFLDFTALSPLSLQQKQRSPVGPLKLIYRY